MVAASENQGLQTIFTYHRKPLWEHINCTGGLGVYCATGLCRATVRYQDCYTHFSIDCNREHNRGTGWPAHAKELKILSHCAEYFIPGDKPKAAVTKWTPTGNQTYSPQKLVSTVRSEVYTFLHSVCAAARYYHLRTHAITMVPFFES